MMPMLPGQRLSQNKISGQLIAWGQAQWQTLPSGKDGYVFPEGSFQLAQSLNHLKELGIEIDDLLDCVKQFEETYGSPTELRMQLGLVKNFGETSPGMTATSASNDRVSCLMTPSSWEVSKVEAYFQWFYRTDSAGDLSSFDDLAGISGAEEPAAPMELPSYDEACLKLADIEISESKKRGFLQALWDYQKNLAPGFKAEARQKLLADWGEFKKKG